MPRNRLPLPKGCPSKLIYHGQTFEPFATGDGRLAFDHYAGGRRVVVRRTTLAKLRTAAEDIAVSIVNAETAARDLTAEDRRIYITARGIVSPLAVDCAVRILQQAAEIVGGVDRIVESCRYAMTHNPQGLACPATAVVLDELLATLADNLRDEKYRTGLESILTKFAAAHPDLPAVGENEVRIFLRGQKKRTGQSIGPRRRNNIRDAIVTLYRFARDRNYLPDRKTVAEKIERLDCGVEVSTYTPQELSLLLEHVTDRWRPLLVLAAFGGLRTSEIFRLEWHSVKWDHMTIDISRRVAKKVKISRRPKISETLAAFLEEYRGTRGALYPNIQTHGLGKAWRTLEDELVDEGIRLYRASGVRWKHNALRHSYGSHRMAIAKNESEVALEMGTSPAMIREHYHDPKSESEAAQYFALRPRTLADNILPLKLEFA